MDDHEGLRTFSVKEYPLRYDSNYSWLEQLLKRNRNIAVVNHSNKTITNGTSLTKLYELNRFYNTSAALVKECQPVRSWVVGTALLEGISQNLQYTALLLSHHTDVLCELLQHSNVAEEVSQSIRRRRRQTSVPLIRAARRRRVPYSMHKETYSITFWIWASKIYLALCNLQGTEIRIAGTRKCYRRLRFLKNQSINNDRVQKIRCLL